MRRPAGRRFFIAFSGIGLKRRFRCGKMVEHIEAKGCFWYTILLKVILYTKEKAENWYTTLGIIYLCTMQKI